MQLWQKAHNKITVVVGRRNGPPPATEKQRYIGEHSVTNKTQQCERGGKYEPPFSYVYQ